MKQILLLLALMFVTVVPAIADNPAGSAYQVLRIPSTGGRGKYGAVDLSQSAATTNQLPIAKGGTGGATKAAAFDALSPMSASGDIIYGGTSGTGTRLGKGSDGQVLTLASGLPSWTSTTSPAYAQAYHDSDCTWSIPSGNAFADPTADTSCTFTQTITSNITLTSANDGTTNHNIPGITFTPVSGTAYLVSAVANYSLAGSATSNEEFRFYDGTSAFWYVGRETQLATTTHFENMPIQAIWVAPNNTAVTIKLQSTTNASGGLNWGSSVDDAANVKSIRWNVIAIH